MLAARVIPALRFPARVLAARVIPALRFPARVIRAIRGGSRVARRSRDRPEAVRLRFAVRARLDQGGRS